MISRAIKRTGVGIAVLSALSHAGSANAMNWCALPEIIPTTTLDFEKTVNKVELLTGCAKQEMESAHIATWVCDDSQLTADIDEQVTIKLFREPGKTVNLVIATRQFDNLDHIRTCGIKNLTNSRKFDPGNTLLRDEIHLGYNTVVSMTTSPITGTSLLISDRKKLSGNGDWSKEVWSIVYGLDIPDSAYTAVRLAGVDPLNSSVLSLVNAFKLRNSSVTATKNLEGTFPEWEMTTPVGLAGVKQVSIKGFLKHFFRVDYLIESTADYQKYVTLLDSEYGTSSRTNQDGCAYRNWLSGDVSILGSFCSKDGSKLSFINKIAAQQMLQIRNKAKTDLKDTGSDDDKIPIIDRDMF